MSNFAKQTLTIANGATLSDALRFDHYEYLGLIFPASFTGATVTFVASDTEDGTYVDVLKDDGNAYTVTASDSKAVAIDPRYVAPWRFLKVKSASAETGAKSITAVMK